MTAKIGARTYPYSSRRRRWYYIYARTVKPLRDSERMLRLGQFTESKIRRVFILQTVMYNVNKNTINFFIHAWFAEVLTDASGVLYLMYSTTVILRQRAAAP